MPVLLLEQTFLIASLWPLPLLPVLAALRSLHIAARFGAVNVFFHLHDPDKHNLVQLLGKGVGGRRDTRKPSPRRAVHLHPCWLGTLCRWAESTGELTLYVSRFHCPVPLRTFLVTGKRTVRAFHFLVMRKLLFQQSVRC